MNPLQRALHMESHVARIIGKQALNGVQFDVTRAQFYTHVLEERTQQLYRGIRPSLQLVVERPYAVPVNEPFLKSGDYSTSVKKWFECADASVVSGAFSRVAFTEPDIGKRQQIVEQLLRLGWVPKEYTPVTEKGGGNNPKITVDGEPCSSLLEINSTIGASLAKWYILKHRQSQIKGFLERVRKDRRISAEAHTIGTPTYRFRHVSVVNVPKASKHVEFGRQMRSLFTVPKGRKLVGHDASGLELRVLAHYINDEDYTRTVSEGDPHTANQLSAGLQTRDQAKTFIYAFIYGAGNKKIGQIVGGSTPQGRAIKERFLQANPKLRALIEGVKSSANKGWVVGIDGRRVRIRKDKKTNRPQVHKALNALIQTGGALVMKYSMIWLDLALQKESLDSHKVIDMHDEGQSEVATEDAGRHAWLACESIRKAGQYLGMRCPLDAEAKIATRWCDTH